jgi:hypothetical protein
LVYIYQWYLSAKRSVDLGVVQKVWAMAQGPHHITQKGLPVGHHHETPGEIMEHQP